MWLGETCVIVAGGPSLCGFDYNRLRGHNLIAINNRYRECPFADILFFGDVRWWNAHQSRLKFFRGLIVTSSDKVRGERVHTLRRRKDPGMSSRPDEVMLRRTSMTAAIEIAKKTGVSKIVVFGMDGQRGPNGELHSHEDHPWPHPENAFEEQRKDLERTARDLKAAGVELLNASPGSALADLWPVVDHETGVGAL